METQMSLCQHRRKKSLEREAPGGKQIRLLPRRWSPRDPPPAPGDWAHGTRSPAQATTDLVARGPPWPAEPTDPGPGQRRRPAWGSGAAGTMLAGSATDPNFRGHHSQAGGVPGTAACTAVSALQARRGQWASLFAGLRCAALWQAPEGEATRWRCWARSVSLSRWGLRRVGAWRVGVLTGMSDERHLSEGWVTWHPAPRGIGGAAVGSQVLRARLWSGGCPRNHARCLHRWPQETWKRIWKRLLRKWGTTISAPRCGKHRSAERLTIREGCANPSLMCEMSRLRKCKCVIATRRPRPLTWWTAAPFSAVKSALSISTTKQDQGCCLAFPIGVDNLLPWQYALQIRCQIHNKNNRRLPLSSSIENKSSEE